MQATPEQNSTCIICLDLVEDKKSYRTMVCPACQHAWFHRSCIQKQAVHAGVCFRCLHCRNEDQFVMEMLTMGIRISKRLVLLFPADKPSGTSAVPGQGLPRQAWPSAVPCLLSSASWRSWKWGGGRNAGTAWICLMLGQQGLKTFPFLLQQTTIMGERASIGTGVSEAQLLQCQQVPLSGRQGAGRGRGVSCQSSNGGLCTGSLSPQGLGEEGLRTRALLGSPLLASLCPHNQQPVCFPRPWQLLLCSSCAAEGTHRHCSYLRNSASSWECDGCAGLGTGKRQSAWVPLGWGQCPG